MNRFAWFAFVSIALSACSPHRTAAPVRVPVTPETNAEQAGAQSSDGGQPSKQVHVSGQAWSVASLVPLPEGVPEAPKECEQYRTRAASSCPAEDGSEIDALLATALGKSGPGRDEALAKLEPCTVYPKGVIRALRADLAPASCADVLTVSVLQSEQVSEVRRDVRDVLAGLTIAARLRRLSSGPPTIAKPFHKEQFTRFMTTKLMPWFKTRARAIDDLSRAASRLKGYGQGLVAIEAGSADLRFVQIVREVPLPVEMAKDPEIRDVYYGALDESLEPRKRRGRDAALVGLVRLHRAGLLRDPRVERARALLSELYNGRRINALDGLLFEGSRIAAPSSEPHADWYTVVSHVPAFYTPLLVPELDATQPSALRALLMRGLAASLRERVVGAELSSEARLVLARGMLEFGRTYWSREDFVLAASLTANVKDPTYQLIHGLAQALSDGPKDAASMMLTPPGKPLQLGATDSLERLARGKSVVAGMASYDLGYLLQLALIRPDDKSYWLAIAEHFERASKKLGAASLRAKAKERAAAARATAKAIR